MTSVENPYFLKMGGGGIHDHNAHCLHYLNSTRNRNKTQLCILKMCIDQTYDWLRVFIHSTKNPE